MKGTIIGFLFFALLACTIPAIAAAPAADKPAVSKKTAKKKKASKKVVISDADIAKAGKVAPIAAVVSAKPADLKGIKVSSAPYESPGINPEPRLPMVPGETSSLNQRALAAKARAISEQRRMEAAEKVAKSTPTASVPGQGPNATVPKK